MTRNSPEKVPQHERQRVRDICRALMGPGIHEAYVVQIERVLWYVDRDGRADEVEEPDDVVALYRSKALIPPILLESLGDAPHCKALAVCYAACIYPNRTNSIDDRLPDRLLAFLEAFQHGGDPIAFLRTERITNESDARETEAFLDDLAAAQKVEAPDDCTKSDREAMKKLNATERRMGAALYLTTWPAEDIQTMFANWCEDRDLVGYMRECLTVPPRTIAEMTGGPLPAPPAGVAMPAPATLFGLEARARGASAAHRQLAKTADIAAQDAQAFWETCWQELTSGFLHYAYRCRFQRWWSVRIAVCWPDPSVKPLPDDMEDTEATGSVAPPLTERLVRMMFEGYRVARDTLFALTDLAATLDKRRKADRFWNVHLCRKLIAEDRVRTLTRIGDVLKNATGKNHPKTVDRIEDVFQKTARAADGETERRLVELLGKPPISAEPEAAQNLASELAALADNVRPAKVKAIAGALGIFEDEANNINHDVRLRITAYQLSRLEGLTNNQIRSRRLPTREGASHVPFQQERIWKGVKGVVVLARMVSEAGTLLLPLTAHRVLRP